MGQGDGLQWYAGAASLSMPAVSAVTSSRTYLSASSPVTEASNGWYGYTTVTWLLSAAASLAASLTASRPAWSLA